MRWLEVTLQAPMMSFGAISIDRFAPTGRFPSKSMIVGMIGSALGLERSNVKALQDLQDKIIFACALEEENGILRDMQNAKLAVEKMWTTRGAPVSRDGGDATYERSVRRTKDYLQDARLRLVIGLKDGSSFTLEEIAEAFRRPVYPISIGRRTCLPSAPMVPPSNEACIFEAGTAYEALNAIVKAGVPARWPLGQGPDDTAAVSRVVSDPGLRNWKSGMHKGFENLVEGVSGNAEVEVLEAEF